MLFITFDTYAYVTSQQIPDIIKIKEILCGEMYLKNIFSQDCGPLENCAAILNYFQFRDLFLQYCIQSDLCCVSIYV